MKIEPVHQQPAPVLFESKEKSPLQRGSIEVVAVRKAPGLDGDALKLAKLRAEMDFDRVKEMVRRVTPSSAYPPLEGVDRLASLFGKSDV